MAVQIRKPREPQPVKITQVIGGPGGDSDAAAARKTEDWIAAQLAHALGLTTYEVNEAMESTEIKTAVRVTPPQGTPDAATTTVEYGTRGVDAHKSLIERAVEAEIARTTNQRSGNLLDGWEWEMRAFGSDIPDHDPDVLCSGEKWIFRPTGAARAYIAQVNHLVNQRGGTGRTPMRDLKPVVGSSLRGMFCPVVEFWVPGSGSVRQRQARSRGFMASAINQVRRNSDSRFWTKIRHERA